MARRAFVVLKILLVFVGVGPLIGLLVFSFGMAVLAMIASGAQGLAVGLFVLIYGLIFAHAVGGLSALIAGGAAGALLLVVGRAPQWIGIASGGVSLVAAMAGGLVDLPPLPEEGKGLDLTSFSTAFLVVMILTHLVAAFGSWEIARRLDLTTTSPTPSSAT